MKYYIIAGEASGDLHGSNLIKSIRQLDTEANIYAWGGELMQNAGAKLRKHYRDLAFMGFIEVVKNLSTIAKNMRFCKQDILDFKPDVIIFIDYPGFNLRIAKWAKQQKIRTFYYISPQIWAWHTSRVHSIKATIDKMFCILPFEKAFYQQFNYEVDFVGHPLLDVINHRQPAPDFREKNNLGSKPLIALLPGSRQQEIKKMLALMLSTTTRFPDYQFVVAAAPSLPLHFYQDIFKETFGEGWSQNIALVAGQTYDLLQNAAAALVKSGTSTLETALLDVPQVVCYKGSSISFAIAKRVIKVKYISLVNLIADKPIVTELIQSDLTTDNMVAELQKAIKHQALIKQDYAILRGMLGNAGASDRTAQLILKYLQESA